MPGRFNCSSWNWNISVSLRMGRGLYSKYYFVCGVFVESDCDKRRKTSRPVGTEVQTRGNFQRNLCYRHNILGCIHCNNHNVFLEFSYSLVACLCSGISLSCDFNVFLHKDLLFPPPLSSPATKPDATNLPWKSTKHITIEKAVSIAVWLQLTLVACYLPHGIVTALWTNNELFPSVYLATKYTVTSVFLNSSLKGVTKLRIADSGTYIFFKENRRSDINTSTKKKLNLLWIFSHFLRWNSVKFATPTTDFFFV